MAMASSAPATLLQDAPPAPAADWSRLIAALADPALVADPAGRLVAANDAAAPMAAMLIDHALRIAAAGGRERVRLLLDGKPRWFDLSVTRIEGARLLLATTREATLEQNLRDALIESRQRFRDLVEMSSDFAWETDATGAFVFVSHDAVLGFATRSMIGRRPAEFMIDPQMEGMPLPFDQAEPVDSTEFWAMDARKQPRCLITVARPIFDAAGVRTGTRGMCRDVTEERIREADLAQAVQGASVLGHILATMREAIEPRMILEAACNAIVPALSAAGCRLYRADTDGALRAAVTIGTPPDRPDDVEVQADDPLRIAVDARYRRDRKGRLVLWRDAEAPPWTAADRALVAKVADQLGVALAEIGERETLERLSATDGLTGLLNRRAFQHLLQQRVVRASIGGERGALLYVDLDNFKQINDRAGHERGDAALKAVAALLTATARPTDLVARLGGDEFALWLDGADRVGTEARAARLLADMAALRAFDVDPARPFGMSIGGAVFDPATQEPVEALIGRADAAMYAGKRAGKGRLTLAEPASGGASEA